jgi:hypothetical protein
VSATIREPLTSGIDMTDPAYYTVANGIGQTTTAREAAIDVDSNPRPAAKCRTSV